MLQVVQQGLLMIADRVWEGNPIHAALPAQQFQPRSLRVSFVMAKASSLSGRKASLTTSSASVSGGD